LDTRPLRDAEVWRGVDTTVTGADGAYALGGKTPRDTLFTRFRSPFLRIRNQAREDVIVGARAHPPGRPLVFEWTDANSDTAGRRAYYHALRIHSLIRAMDPELKALDFRMPCRI